MSEPPQTSVNDPAGTPDRSLQRQLIGSVERGELDRIRALIAAGAEVNFSGQDPDGETPLIRAVVAEQAAAARLLIESGADVNCAGRLSGWTPLMFARDQPLIMRELIAAGADVNARTPAREMVSPVSGRRIRRGGETALHLAAAANNVEAIRILVEAGAEVEAVDENGCAPLDVALRVGRPNEAATALVEAGAELTTDRIEAMHAGAKPADDLSDFVPLANESDLNQRKGAVLERTPRNETHASDATRTGETTCPNCGALLYSRKARICGSCGAALSPELRISDDQRQILEDQRKWARDLADGFDPKRRSSNPQYQDATVSLEETLRRGACAVEFNRRRRRRFMGYVIVFAFLAAVTNLVFSISFGEVLPSVFFVSVMTFGLFSYQAWRNMVPACPNCGQDIKKCAATYCHFCGKTLQGQYCKDCTGSDFSSGLFSPHAHDPDNFWIRYCPACGVWLDSKTFRYRAG